MEEHKFFGLGAAVRVVWYDIVSHDDWLDLDKILQGHDDHDLMEMWGRVVGVSDRDELIVIPSPAVLNSRIKAGGTVYWIPIGCIKDIEVLDYPELSTERSKE